MATLEQQVEEEHEEYEPAQVDTDPDKNGGDSEQGQEESGAAGNAERDTGTAKSEDALFDKSAYETEALALPKIDGEGVDKIAVKFAGTVWLERGDEADVALLKNTRLGQKVMLAVEAEVGPPVPSLTTNRDGDLDVISLSRKFTVVNVHRAVGEGLEAA